jgi:hypothetical protein
VKIGSDEHKELFCRGFIDSHVAYDPERLPWPELEGKYLERMRAVPYWEEVFYAERRAGMVVRAFAETIADPLMREAVDLQGLEESRHAQLIRAMIRRYGIDAEEKPVAKLPQDIRTAFLDFGYGECVDSFVGFGAFKLARESGFLPEGVFALFDAFMQEETRHIVFFVNWMAYQEARKGPLANVLRGLTSAWYHGRAVANHVRNARKEAKGGRNFSAVQAEIFPQGFDAAAFLADCLAEYRRRMAPFDPRLLRPRLMASVGAWALSVLRLMRHVRRKRNRSRPS